MSRLLSFCGVLACGLVLSCSLLTVPRAQAVVTDFVATVPAVSEPLASQSAMTDAPARTIPAIWRYDNWQRDWQPGVRRPGSRTYVPNSPYAGRYGYAPRWQSHGRPRRNGNRVGSRPYDREYHLDYRWHPQWRGNRDYRDYGDYRYDSRRVGAHYGWRAY